MGDKLEIGAIITVAGNAQAESGARVPYLSQPLGGRPLACHEILGANLLNRTLESLRLSGIQSPSVLFEDSGCDSLFPSRQPAAGKFFSEWESAVADNLDQGVRSLVLIRLGSYLEIDFTQLITFHRESESVLTQVFGQKSAYDVAAVDANHLRGEKGSYRGRLSALIPYHRRFPFSGYSNRLREPQDFRRLAHDGLTGRNAIVPVGKEVSPGIWLGEGARIDPTARISAPAYIGRNSVIKGSCHIHGASTIERDCEVDFGTSVTDSSVLPGTYLGIGLNIVHSIVDSNKLFHLNRNVEVEISDRNMLGSKRSRSVLTKLMGERSFFNRRNSDLNQVDAHLY